MDLTDCSHIASKLRSPVQLAKDKNEDFLHWFLEQVVFCRRQWMKNEPRTNYAVYRSIWSVTFCLVIVPAFLSSLLFGVGCAIEIVSDRPLGIANVEHWIELVSTLKPSELVKLLFGYVGAVSLVYWNTTTVFRQQWQYVASLYNDVLKAEDPIIKNLLSNGLAIDMTVLDLWAHRLFADAFAQEIREALIERHKGNPLGLFNEVNRFNRGSVTEKEARELLEQHQDRLPGPSPDGGSPIESQPRKIA